MDRKVNPVSFPTYKYAYVEWKTLPELVFEDVFAHKHIRGILTIKYLSENKYNLKPNSTYEIDTEITVSNSENPMEQLL